MRESKKLEGGGLLKPSPGSCRVKVIALSETAINDTAINYHIPNYNCEMNIRHRRRGGGVNLYVHNTFQYKLRNDLL